jgi:hypothetical protein
MFAVRIPYKFPLKQTFEIASTKPVEVVPLDDLNEYGGPIHQRLRS